MHSKMAFCWVPVGWNLSQKMRTWGNQIGTQIKKEGNKSANQLLRSQTSENLGDHWLHHMRDCLIWSSRSISQVQVKRSEEPTRATCHNSQISWFERMRWGPSLFWFFHSCQEFLQWFYDPSFSSLFHTGDKIHTPKASRVSLVTQDQPRPYPCPRNSIPSEVWKCVVFASEIGRRISFLKWFYIHYAYTQPTTESDIIDGGKL